MSTEYRWYQINEAAITHLSSASQKLIITHSHLAAAVIMLASTIQLGHMLLLDSTNYSDAQVLKLYIRRGTQVI